MDKKLNTIAEALGDLREGKMLIVVDDENRENEGDMLCAAQFVTHEVINFMVRHARGLICAPLTEKRCDELGLEPMVTKSNDPKKTAYTVSVDLIGEGVSTGISAADRAKTVQALINEKTLSSDFMRPGHIFPLRAKEGGVLKRAGHTEAAIDLTRLAGLKQGGAICEIMNEDGTMARLPQLLDFAEKWNLKIISIEDLIHYRLLKGDLVDRIEERKNVKTCFGEFDFFAYREKHTEQIHFAFTKGIWSEDEPVLVRVQSSNTYFDVLNRMVNGEIPLLEKISAKINYEGKGAMIFINNVANAENTMKKLAEFLDFQNDGSAKPSSQTNFKDYGIGIQILKDLGISKFKILTKNTSQKPIVGGYGVEVTEMVEI